jgi:hypothetical protein
VPQRAKAISKRVDRFNRNRWLQLLLAIGGIAGLVVLLVPLVQWIRTDDPKHTTFDIAVKNGKAPSGSPKYDYRAIDITRTWVGDDYTRPSTWRAGDIVVFGVPFKDALASTLRPGIPTGIELELPEGTSSLKVVIGQTGSGPADVPLTYSFETGSSRFSAVAQGKKYAQGIDVRLEPGQRLFRVQVETPRNTESSVEAVIAFASATA